MIPVAGYCRVSTNKEDQANSFESQKRFFHTFIENRPVWSLYEIYADEGITGTNTKKRTHFNRMIQDAYAGKFRMIVTKEVSRFSRNILDTIRYTRELKAIGVTVLFVNDGIDTADPDSELRLSIMASIAQEESRKTSSRVVWGQTRQMERGVVFGRSLLGYDVNDGKISVNPEGAQIVRKIFHLYAIEQMSTGKIANHLTKEGYRTQGKHREWNPSVITKILRNEKYVGDLVQKKTYTPDYLTHTKCINRGEVPRIGIENHHEPIVSREIWDAVQKRLEGNNKHRKNRDGYCGEHVFSGKIRCGLCGSNFVSRVKKRKDGTGYRRWCCAKAARGGSTGCKIGILIRDDDAKQIIRTSISKLPIDRDKLIDEVRYLAIKAIDTDEKDSNAQLSGLKREEKRVKEKIQSTLDSYFAAEISKEEMLLMKNHYYDQIEQIRKRIDRIQEKPLRDEIKQAERIEDCLKSILEGNTENEAMYKYITDCLTVHPDRKVEVKLKDEESRIIFLI